MIWKLLIRLGFDLTCLCGHRRSEHDFTRPTESGFCQNGSWREGCDCCIYEPKGFRPVDPDRGTGIM